METIYVKVLTPWSKEKPLLFEYVSSVGAVHRRACADCNQNIERRRRLQRVFTVDVSLSCLYKKRWRTNFLLFMTHTNKVPEMRRMSYLNVSQMWGNNNSNNNNNMRSLNQDVCRSQREKEAFNEGGLRRVVWEVAGSVVTSKVKWDPSSSVHLK